MVASDLSHPFGEALSAAAAYGRKAVPAGHEDEHPFTVTLSLSTCAVSEASLTTPEFAVPHQYQPQVILYPHPAGPLREPQPTEIESMKVPLDVVGAQPEATGCMFAAQVLLDTLSKVSLTLTLPTGAAPLESDETTWNCICRMKKGPGHALLPSPVSVV